MKLSWIFSAAFFFLSAAVSAQHLTTASALTYKLPRLSPRPQSLYGARQSCISLDGTWKFTGGKAINENIKVPGEWEMQGFKLDSAATARYARTFFIPADWK